MKRRVVITGMGAVTPIGNTLDEFWNGIKEEKVGIGAITKFDTEDYKVKIAAEVKKIHTVSVLSLVPVSAVFPAWRKSMRKSLQRDQRE